MYKEVEGELKYIGGYLSNTGKIAFEAIDAVMS